MIRVGTSLGISVAKSVSSLGSAAPPISLAWDATDPDTVIYDAMDSWSYFKQIKLVTVDDNLNETSILATYSSQKITGKTDGTDGQVMVRLPKLYYKEYFNADGWLTGFEISGKPKAGLTLHPAFYPNNDYIYIGAYEGSEVNGKAASVSGQPVKTSVTLDNARYLAIARDTANQATSKWHLMSGWTQHLIQLLFYAYYGNIDSQSVLEGYTEASGWDYNYTRLTGRSNILEKANGNVDVDLAGTDIDLDGIVTPGNKVANRFLWIENIFGHVWKMLDGISYDGRVGSSKKAYMADDPRIYSSNEADILSYPYSYDLLVNGGGEYIKALGGAGNPYVGGAASSSTYFSDYMWSYLSDSVNRDFLRLVLVGASLYLGRRAGVGSRYSYYGLSTSSSSIGFRLCGRKKIGV